MRIKFLLALFLSLIFTIALIYSTFEIPRIANYILLIINPDKVVAVEQYGIISNWEAIEVSINALRPIGYASLIITIILIALGFSSKWRPISILGSLTLYLPVFGYFAFTMFFLAGIGILRLLWLPLFDISPYTLELGSITFLPYRILDYILAHTLNAIYGDSTFTSNVLHKMHLILTLTIMGMGILVFLLGALTWFYSRYEGLNFANIWIYKYLRHPQYLGVLLWSYSLLLLSTILPIRKDGYVPPPSLPWLILVLLLIGLSLIEEIDMSKKFGKYYDQYRKKTSFMVPLPKKFSHLLSAPARFFIKKNYPQNRKEVLFIVSFYAIFFILLSIPLIIWKI